MANGGNKYSTDKKGKYAKAGYKGAKTQYRSKETEKRYGKKHKEGRATSHSGGKAGTHLGGKWDKFGGWGKSGWNAREGGDEVDDRPADTGANMAASEGRGDTPQGTTAATQRPGIENWYHDSDKYSNPELTKTTTRQEWNETNRRRT